MNRRSFFTKLGLAAATLAVLPGATTYARKWVAGRSGLLMPTDLKWTTSVKGWVVNPAWVDAPFEMVYLRGAKTVGNLPIIRFKQGADGQIVHVPQFINL